MVFFIFHLVMSGEENKSGEGVNLNYIRYLVLVSIDFKDLDSSPIIIVQVS